MKAISKLMVTIGWFIGYNLNPIYGQECMSFVQIELQNTDGGMHVGEKVVLQSIKTGAIYSASSNKKGIVNLEVPCSEKFKVTMEKCAYTEEIETLEYQGVKHSFMFGYSADSKAKSAFFKMNAAEKNALDLFVKDMKDTIVLNIKDSLEFTSNTYFSRTTIKVHDFGFKPLMQEELWVTGMKRGVTFYGKTNHQGEIVLYLPKGDDYSINFKHHKDFVRFKSSYEKGTTTIHFSYSYLGTKEVERRMKIEADRIRKEEERLRIEHEKFLAFCEKHGVDEKEGRILESKIMIENMSNMRDTVVIAALNRNKWKDKLIVCDLTGSMSPYVSQLSLWYALNFKKEKTLQFVFFNDGDNKPDHQKVIGNTGGIYYSPSKGLEHFNQLTAEVANNGNGGDCPENNMEALIKGTKKASKFKELVMIADNNAPVKDLVLLSEFTIPVRIILCGLNGSQQFIHPDYLEIAWKTGGSVHTIEEDILSIANMLEGEKIEIAGFSYKIMGGKFVRIFDS